MSSHDNVAIRVANVSKSFKLPHEKNSSIKGALINFRRGKRGFEKQQVLQDISFEVKKGEFFGIVGRNGSGKSTMLKLLAGIYSQDKGGIDIQGKLTPFIELGVGFNPELTGRENVFLNGALLGFNRREMEAMYDDIVSFAELGRFMDQKLKNYSSGMQVRLAFSIATRAKSDILLIDEVLAVGDAAFQNKCFDYFYELKKRGATVVFVSHDRGSLERFCDRGVLIDQGKLITQGKITTVLNRYAQIVMQEMENSGKAEEMQKHDGKPQEVFAKIHDVKSLGADNVPKNKFTVGEAIRLQYSVTVQKELTDPILGVTLWCKNVNKPPFAANTLIDGVESTGAFKPGDTITFTVDVPPVLNDGEFYVEPAIANRSATVFYDQVPQAATLFISGSDNPHAMISNSSKIVLTRT